jgi:aquaporin Z
MMRESLKHHWPEYFMEAAGLGLFMISAATFAILLEHPASPFRHNLHDPTIRRFVMGVAMGLTAILIIYSPWGKQSGAHINPSVTLTFFRLGKIQTWDAVFYILFQCLGRALGIILVSLVAKSFLVDPSVNYVATLPGPTGEGQAFLAEWFISFGLMMVVLISSNHPRLSRYTGVFAGILVATYITLEAPISGMSMNPARSLASVLPAWLWTSFWIYITAPVLGMLLAAETYLRVPGLQKVWCAKLYHHNAKRCIFRCGYHEERSSNTSSLQASA